MTGGRALATLALTLALTTCTDTHLQEVAPVPTFLDDKLAVTGAFCTQSPESLVFPLRVLFVVDSSESMRITDPPDPTTGITRREDVVREVWTELLAQGIQDVRVGIVRFSAEAQSRTPVDVDGDGVTDTWFTADPVQLDVATAALAATDRVTNYASALAEAHFELRGELAAADLESLPLSKYVVVFLSDGVPDVDPTDAQGNGASQILAGVDQLRELAALFRVGQFSFHTVYLSAGQGPAADKPAQDLLQQMAAAGGGTYRSIPNGEAINFIGVDFSVIRRVFTLKTLAVINLNAVLDDAQVQHLRAHSTELEERLTPEQIAGGFTDTSGDAQLGCGEPLVDSDGDGLADLVEVLIGTDPLLPDSDDDGLSDRLEWDLAPSRDPLDPSDAGCYVPSPCTPDATDPNDPTLCACIVDLDVDGVCDCAADPDSCADPDLGRDCTDLDLDGWCDCDDFDHDGFCDYPDRDGDLLPDCEEIYFGTAKNGVDSDADGLPDLMEVRRRTSPVAIDVAGDYDFDKTKNGAEVAGGTDPLCDDAALRSRLAYRYHLETTGLEGDRTCYAFTVSNITLVPTLPNPSPWAHPTEPEATDDAFPFDPADPTVSNAINYHQPVHSPTGPLGDGLNRILVFAGEVAFDDPGAYARFRVACVAPRFVQPGSFKNPPSGKLALTEADFVDVADFDPETDCRRP